MLFHFALFWLLCAFSAAVVAEQDTVAPNTRQKHLEDSASPPFAAWDPADEEWEDDDDDEPVIDRSKAARDGLVFLATFYSLLGLMFAWAASKDKEFEEEEKAKSRAKAKEDKKTDSENKEYEEVWTVAEKFGHGEEDSI